MPSNFVLNLRKNAKQDPYGTLEETYGDELRNKASFYSDLTDFLKDMKRLRMKPDLEQ